MNFASELGKVLIGTLIVSVAVYVGFILGEAIGLPIWLQGICLIPAGYLFFYLAGEKMPPLWKILGFMAVLSVISLVFVTIFPKVPAEFRSLFFVVFVVLMPSPQTLLKWVKPGAEEDS